MDVSDDENEANGSKTTEPPIKEFKLPSKFKDVEFSKLKKAAPVNPVNEFNIDPTKSFFDTSGDKKAKKTTEKTKESKPEPAKAFGLKIRSMASINEVKKEVIEAPSMDEQPKTPPLPVSRPASR